MKKLLGNMIGLTAVVPLAGATISGIGSAGMGALGGVTQSMVSLGVVSKASKMFKW